MGVGDLNELLLYSGARRGPCVGALRTGKGALRGLCG